MYVYVHVCDNKCICLHTHVSALVRVLLCLSARTFVRTYAHKYVSTCVFISVLVRIFICTYIYILQTHAFKYFIRTYL